jgi:hypothetical protein
MKDNPFVGKWTYRSFLNDPDLAIPSGGGDPNVNPLLFGYGTIAIEEAASQLLIGTIGGSDWSLKLHGSRAYGSPMQVRFQGKGIVSGAEWIYDYIAWLVPVWPNSDETKQRAALVGSVTRTIPHPSKGGVAPAGVVASFYAVRAD